MKDFMNNLKICSIPGCGNPTHQKSWCGGHYWRYRKYGDPLAGSTSNGEPLKYLLTTVLIYQGNDCLIWPYCRNGDGYARIVHEGKSKPVHRIVCEKINGPPPKPNYDAAHSCGKGHLGCVSPMHVSWKTRKDNLADCLIHGTHRRGSRNPPSKLSESDVRTIRGLKGSKSAKIIAEMLNVSPSSVHDIFAGRTWNWME